MSTVYLLYFSSTFHAWAALPNVKYVTFCQADGQLVIKEHRSARFEVTCIL